jgi:hypothetical protein
MIVFATPFLYYGGFENPHPASPLIKGEEQNRAKT